MLKNKHPLFWNILLILYLAAVAFLCFGRVTGPESLPKVFFGIHADKIAHFLMFVPFLPLVYMATGFRSRKWWQALLFSVLLYLAGIGLAWFTEYIQGMIPYRTKDIEDFKADAYALCLGASIQFCLDLVSAATSSKRK